MKRIIAGGFISLVGSLWSLAVMGYVGNHLVSSWSTPPGRFLASVLELHLTVPLILAAGVALAGMWMMLLECFRD